MEQALLKAGSFVVVILLGYFLRRFGVFGPNAYQVMTKIALNVTLPAAVITSFAGLGERDNTLFLLVGIGFLLNVVMFLVGFLVSRKKDKKDKAFYLLCCPGYSIGSFTLPFVQNFFGAFGVVGTCMFDIGNSMMCTGGSYTVAAALTGDDAAKKIDFRAALKRLFTSIPFVTYLLMLVLSLLDWRIPEPVVTLSSTIAAANGFAAMMMIGMMFKLELKKEYLKAAGIVLLLRYSFAAAFSAFFYFCLPLPLEIRQILAVVSFGPLSALTPAFVEKLKGNAGLASVVSSASIIISIAIMTVLMMVMEI